MESASVDQAVVQTMNELMRASSDCAEFDPAMSAKFAAAAKDLARDFGITPVLTEHREASAEPLEDEADEQEDEFGDLLRLLDLQKKAIAAAEVEARPKSRFGWLNLDVWSRW
jgi:hypothetical protein